MDKSRAVGAVAIFTAIFGISAVVNWRNHIDEMRYKEVRNDAEIARIKEQLANFQKEMRELKYKALVD